MHDFTPISYTGADGLALHARDYPSALPTAGAPAAGAPAAGAPAAGTPAAGAPVGRLPVVCIHGLTRNAADFEEFAPRVAALGRRVLAPDIRGRGHSAHDSNTANYNARIYVQDVVRLMEVLGLPQAVFVGTSMGGLITMLLADSRIDLVAAAVLNDIGPEIAEAGLERIAGYVGKPVAAANWRDAAARVRDINGCAFPDYDDAHWDRWARRVYKPDGDGALVARYDPAVGLALQNPKHRTTTSPELQRAFAKLAHERPVLLVRGALSDLLEPQHAEAMRRTAPALRYVEVPRVGHAPMLTEAPAFDAIAAFLADVP